MRCDVNLSIRKRGEHSLGVRTEIKNLNSFSFVEKAIGYETQRQIHEWLENGCVKQSTMRFLPSEGRTVVMRRKEESADYRFIPEPDLPPFRISKETVARMRLELPELPSQKRVRLVEQYGISLKEAEILAQDCSLAAYFEATAEICAHPKLALNLLLTDLLRFCESDPFRSPISETRLAELADLLGEGTVNSTTAKKLLLRLTETDFSPREIAEREGLIQIRDRAVILSWIEEVLDTERKSLADYLGGKKNAIRALQGKLMAKSQGRADPVLAEVLLREALEKKEEEADA